MNTQDLLVTLSALQNSVRNSLQEDHTDAVNDWLMAATLRIWGANRLFSQSYADLLSVFHQKTYTSAQISTALHCAAEKERSLTLPPFFRSIVSSDLATGKTHSRSLAEEIPVFLASMAAANGDFTLEEAAVLREISTLLSSYCDTQGIPPLPSHTLPKTPITALNESGYYSSSKKPQAEDVLPSAPSPSAPENTITIPITLTLEASPQLNSSPDLKQIPVISATSPKVPEPVSSTPSAQEGDTLERVLAELNSLVGLAQVKDDVQSLINFLKICRLREERGMRVPTVSYHLVFTGNPGTGKTTVARLVAKLYYLMGLLPQGQLVETDRSGLVAGYLGQTAIKTQKVIQEALGGVLFIDEAYSLANEEDDSYGKEAIETILKAMEDHRDELVVIVAGYDELMHQFIDSNPGLRSRFNKYFHFPDYDSADLLKILHRFCKTNGYALAEDAIPLLEHHLKDLYLSREKHFGNARTIRNLFEHAINRQADRLAKDPHITDEELICLTSADIRAALEEF